MGQTNIFKMKIISFAKRAPRALLFGALVAPLVFTSCMDNKPGGGIIDEQDVPGVFIVNEGNFGSANASLSFYDPDKKTVENDVVARANEITSLGDTAQSMTIYDGKGYVVVNNSGVVFVIDPGTFKVEGTISPFTSPRYIHFVSKTKAYVSELGGDIKIVDPSTREITGSIDLGENSAEQMAQWGKWVFATCWSGGDSVIVIDTETDEIADRIEVGAQPASIVLDANGKIWTIADGAWDGSIPPALFRIDAATRTVEKEFEMVAAGFSHDMCLDSTGETLYFVNGGVWRMDVGSNELPSAQFITPGEGSTFSALAIDPETEEIYIADALDYAQSGTVYRYSASGTLTDDFKVGIIPGAFCFVK